MADSAVRVDILVGQNTVVPAVEQTSAALRGANQSANVVTGSFQSLSTKGLKAVEVGFRQVAFQAAGVPGPMGKIAEGALLLGGGSGVLLGVAVAAGTLALAWSKLGATGAEAEAALTRMNAALDKTSQAMRDLAAADAAVSKKTGFAAALLNASQWFPGLQLLAAKLLDTATGIRAVADAYARLESHKAADDVLSQMWDRLDARDKGTHAAKPVTEVSGMSPHDLEDQWRRFANSLGDVAAKAQGPIIELQNGIGGMIDQIEADLSRGIEMVMQFNQVMNDILLGGMQDLAVGLGEALGGGGGFGDIILTAFGNLMQQMGTALIGFGLAMVKLLPALANPFTSGAAAIAAGIALVAIGTTLRKIASGSGPSTHTATGGVNAGQQSRDQQDISSRGTVTVKLGDGFVRANDPAFQEFLAEVIKQGKGRNVVFA